MNFLLQLTLRGPAAGTCIEMLSDPERARAMAQRGKQRVQELFTPEQIARQTEQVYLRLLAERENVATTGTGGSALPA